MKIRFKSNYYRNGSPVFVFWVDGTPQEVAAYKEVQSKGGYYVEDNNEFTDYFKTQKNPNQGKPLFYSPRALADGTELTITFNGRVVPNDPDAAMRDADTMQHLIMEKRAELIAKQQFSNRRSATTAFGAGFTTVNAGTQTVGNLNTPEKVGP